MRHGARARLTLLRAGVYVPAIFAGAFAFSVGFDVGITSFWDSWNKGVSRAAARLRVAPHSPLPVCRSPETMAGHPPQVRGGGVDVSGAGFRTPFYL